MHIACTAVYIVEAAVARNSFSLLNFCIISYYCGFTAAEAEFLDHMMSKLSTGIAKLTTTESMSVPWGLLEINMRHGLTITYLDSYIHMHTSRHVYQIWGG